MDMEAVLHHHLFDHAFLPLFSAGGVQFSLTKHLVIMWLVGAFLLAVVSWAVRGTSRAAALVRGAVEAVTVYLRDTVVEPILGHAGAQYMPYFLSLFFFILLCNLAGLIPGSATATGNIAVTAGLSVCTFFLIVIAGVREQGLVSYVKHIVPGGVPWPLIPMMFVIEVLGMVVKCFALTIRLFANMTAGHIVALGFMSLIFIFGAVNQYVGLFLAAPFSVSMVLFVLALELLVATIQAFIFTLLTAVFVGSALHPH